MQKTKQRTPAIMTGFEQYTKKTRRAQFLEEMEQAGGTALSQAGQRSAAGGSGTDAADLFSARVVQPVGSGGGRGPVRLGGAARVRGHGLARPARARRDNGVQVRALAGRAPPGRADARDVEPAFAVEGSADHDGHDRGRDHHPRTFLDEEPGRG